MRFRLAPLFAALALPSIATASTTSSLGEPGGEARGLFSGLVQSAGVHLFSGAVAHGVPLLIPPGRKDATPELRLVFSGETGDGAFGRGWSLPLGHIERSTKNGVPRCTGEPGFNFTDDFVLVLGGSAQELVPLSTGGVTYRPKRDTSFLEAKKDESANTWQVVDQSGMQYKFGTAPAALLWTGAPVFRDAQDCEFTAVWGLTQIIDTNGNTIDIDYLAGVPALFPQYIRYGATSGSHPFQIRFVDVNHPNPVTSFRRGVRERPEKLVSQVVVEWRNSPSGVFSEVRTYSLTYDNNDLQSSCGDPNAVLLCQISAPLVPTQTFSYSNSDLVLGASGPVSSPDENDKLRQGSGTNVTKSVMDMNGDGLTDLVRASSNNTWEVYLGTPNGISEEPVEWDGPGRSHLQQQTDGSGGVGTKVRRETIDLSGDGIPDYVESEQLVGGGWQVHLGERSCNPACTWGFSQSVTNWTAPEPELGASGSGGTTKALVDVNGDGRPDLVKLLFNQQTQIYSLNVYLNTGAGFTSQPIPDFEANGVFIRSSAGGFTSGMLFDFNADGLVDSVRSGPSQDGIEVLLNNGHGFEPPIFSPTPEMETTAPTYINDCYGSSCGFDFLDLNGDGLPDRVRVGSDQKWKVQFNRGEKLATTAQGLADETSWSNDVIGLIRENEQFLGHTGTDVLDWNGDGILDRVDASNSTTWQVRLGGPRSGGKAHRPFLLTAIDNGLGGKTSIRYEASTTFVNKTFPLVTWVTTGVRRTDGLCDASSSSDPFSSQSNPCINSGHEIVRTYSYEGGLFDGPSREFRGFEKVVESDMVGNHVDATFDQTDAMGRELSREVFASSNRLRRETLVWDSRADGARIQLWAAQRKYEEFSVPDEAGLRLCRMDLLEDPDLYGRVSTSCSYDCKALTSVPESCATVAIGAVRTTRGWAQPDAPSSVRSRPSSVAKAYQTAAGPGGWTPLTEERFRYDGKSEGFVGAGNVTKVIAKLDRSYAQVDPNQDPPDPEVSATYDEYGNITSVTDARGMTVTLNYTAPDNPFKLYAHQLSLPDTGTTQNPIHHVTTQTADIRYGASTNAIDENNIASSYTYDSLGRVTCEALPDDTCGPSGYASRRYDYQYRVANANLSLPYEGKLSYVEVSERSGPTSFLARRTYFDALGRKRFSTVQRLVENGSSLETVIEGQTEYDANGRVKAAYSPYVGPALATPPSIAGATELDYNLNGIAGLSDPLGRPYRVIPPDGKARKALFKGIETHSIDPVGSTTVSTRDGFGREVEHEVYESTPTPTTEPVTRTVLTLDGLGRILASTTTDPEPNPEVSFTATSVFDTLGREVARSDPDSGSWKFGYDAGGNLTYYSSPKPNQHVELCYDILGRPSARYSYTGEGYAGCSSPTASPESSYAYDQGTNCVGRLRSVTDSSGSPGDGEVFTYDTRGRVTRSDKTVLGKTAAMKFQYDEAGRLWKTTYPDNELVTNTYRPDGQVGAVSGGLAYMSSATYDVFGRPKTIGHGNSTQDILELPCSRGLFSERSTMLRRKESRWGSEGSSSLSSRARPFVWCESRGEAWRTWRGASVYT